MGATIYISDVDIQKILKRYSLDTASGGDNALDADELSELVEEAVGEFETKMCARFVVPLVSPSGNYDSVISSTKSKAKIAVKAMIRVVLSRDFGVNAEFGNDNEYVKSHMSTFKDHIKDFLDPKKEWGLKRQSFAGAASQPVQEVGIARGDHDFESF